MLEIVVPGFEALHLEHLVLDYNGTLARDGRLIAEVGERLRRLAGALQIHVLTADTFGSVRGQLDGIDCELGIISGPDEAQAKLDYVSSLGPGQSACIGNGRNDRLMLDRAALGIVVVQAEGAAREAFLAADLAVPTILEALDLLLHPKRLVATLRG